MKEALSKILAAAKAELEKAADPKALEEARVRYLGKKGELTAILKQMGSLSAEERPVIGQLANEVRSQIEELLESTGTQLKAKLQQERLKAETLDVTSVSYTHLTADAYSSYGSGEYADIRRLLNLKKVIEADELLEGIPADRRSAEWHYLKGVVYYNRGWLEERCV